MRTRCVVQEERTGMEMKRDLRVLSLFSGAGGMDLGFEGDFLAPGKSIDGTSSWVRVPATRFKTVFANDILKDARTAWTEYFCGKRGHSPETYHLESVVELVKRHEAGENVFPSDIDVVTGGFPCQDFSVAGKRLGFDSNKNDLGNKREISEFSETSRGKLYYWMKRVIDIVRPKLFIAENVKGLVSLGDALEVISQDFAGNGGYFVLRPQLLKAWEYGVPESRERVIIIGIRRDAMKDSNIEKLLNIETATYVLSEDSSELEYFPYPVKTHGDGRLPLVTCKDVLGGLKEPSEETDDLSQKAYSTAKFLGRGKQGQTEIKWNGLGPTIRSEHHGNIEFRRLCAINGGKMKSELAAGKPERRLTVRECAMIQTFPPDYEFVIKRDSVRLTQSGAYKIIGNAVPPVLAYKIARRLEDVWEKIF